MRLCKITLKNYRCFADSHPAMVEIGAGFTAFVGPNNSGKSSFLKFFLEVRRLFVELAGGGIQQLINGPHGWGSASHVDDPREVFHNKNDRPLQLCLDVGRIDKQLTSISLEQSRTDANTWKAIEFKGNADGAKLEVSASSTLYWKGGGPADITYTAMNECSKNLCEAMYVGPFRNAISEGAGHYYDLAIGTSFIQTWDNWKTGPSKRENEAVQSVTDDIAHIFGFKHLEINATPDKKALQILVDKKPYRLRELGAGLAQFIIVFGNVAIRRPSFLLIDEPELNLHPSLQSDFLTSLAAYTRHGVVFATHSIGLARTIADRIFTFKREGDSSRVRTFEQTPNYAEFLGEMSFSSFKELGFETVLLVEGVTEVKAVQQFLRALGKDHQIVVLPLGGAQMIRGGVQQELSELARISRKVAVLIDSEIAKQGQALDPQRTEFVKDCKALGFRVHVTQRRAFENYLTESALKAAKGPNFKALGAYEPLKTAATGWAKSDNWRIARAMTREEILASDNDVGQFLDALK